MHSLENNWKTKKKGLIKFLREKGFFLKAQKKKTIILKNYQNKSVFIWNSYQITFFTF